MLKEIELKIRENISNIFSINHSEEENKLVSESIWDNSKEQYQKDNFKLYWELLHAVEKYQMKCITGDENLHYFWYALKYAKENIGDKNLKGLFIGCHEWNPGPEISLMKTGCFSKIDVMDISEGLLKKQFLIASELGVNGIEYIKQDFNKIILKKKEYDVIWAIGTIHHIENLEVFFCQINDALKNDGILVMREYIGPNRLQFTERQLNIINEILSILPEKFKTTPDGAIKHMIKSPDLDKLIKTDPSESIRSQEIMPLMEKTLEIFKFSYTGGTILHPLLDNIASNFERDEEGKNLLEILILLEKVLIENNVLPSDYVFCMAKKKK